MRRACGRQDYLVQSITWVARPVDQGPFDEDSPFRTDFVTQSAADMETIAGEAESERIRRWHLRFGWFYAGGYGAHALFRRTIWRRIESEMGDATWEWVHVDDAANAFAGDHADWCW